MKKYFILFFFILSGNFLLAQSYPNIVSYNINETPINGTKIKTNIPFANGYNMPLVKIEGYDYGKNKTLNLNISWYVFDNAFCRFSISSNGGSIPEVWLANENGKVIIFLNEKVYYQRFSVSAFSKGLTGDIAANFSGWTVVDQALSGTNQTQLPYVNNFGGNVGIGTETPQATLDVNGNIKTKGFDVIETSSNSLKSVLARLSEGNTVGEGTYLGVKAYNTSPINSKSFSLEHKFYGELNSSINFFRGGSTTGGFITISVNKGTDLCKFSNKLLDINGTIRAQEVKVEATGWADFVFSKDYKLPDLSEVENHIKEHNRLPEIPSEQEVKENGVDLGDMQVKLLKKIEELTLYVIDLKKESQKQVFRIQTLEEENHNLKANYQ